jgi:hypothetical protein
MEFLMLTVAEPLVNAEDRTQNVAIAGTFTVHVPPEVVLVTPVVLFGGKAFTAT